MNKEAKHSDAKRPKENQEIIALRKAMSKALEEKDMSTRWASPIQQPPWPCVTDRT
ncbi:MAG: hypothetical protein ACLVAW_04540 [Eisenbergiella massiliensis]